MPEQLVARGSTVELFMEDMRRLEALVGIVERIQYEHWDMAACQCWFCRSARDAGCRPRGVRVSRPRLELGKQLRDEEWSAIKEAGGP